MCNSMQKWNADLVSFVWLHCSMFNSFARLLLLMCLVGLCLVFLCSLLCDFVAAVDLKIYYSRLAHYICAYFSSLFSNNYLLSKIDIHAFSIVRLHIWSGHFEFILLTFDNETQFNFNLWPICQYIPGIIISNNMQFN